MSISIPLQIDDLTLALENVRSDNTANDRRVKKYENALNEAQATAQRMSMEKDQVDRELREKETRILTMQRELEDLQDRLEESERQRSSQSRELQDLVASKDDVGKNVFELERAKNSLEVQEKQLRQQLEELEEELAVLEATRDRLEVNMGAMKGEYERELNAKEDQLEDIRRTLGKQVIRSVTLFFFYITFYRLYLLFRFASWRASSKTSGSSGRARQPLARSWRSSWATMRSSLTSPTGSETRPCDKRRSSRTS